MLALCSATLVQGVARATIPIRPGDTIIEGGNRCTLGYVFRRSGSTMGLTAGHCQPSVDAQITDRDAGIAGFSVGVSPEFSLRQDWQLIDFGDVAWSQNIRSTNYEANARGVVTFGQEMCHYGVGSGATSCGTTISSDGATIAVAARSAAGDSGGPCFVRTGGHEVAIVGLWHGHDAEIADMGFCVDVNAALRAFQGGRYGYA
ncbi:hypothetical protein C0J29_31770 (plasmid) [Mycobacterium paragordonae]|uniref:Serine protease n=2 Tax=Mycobacterium paragordonae TaxID=1389713 RepID=A0ABQ1CFH7_9MYCO|nr:hypothetical protein C0J29_31770 [Mycobacterium paragordonae]GFG83241.1 hypothetical protein MPRG_65170 [Mycobacterium paragordonae]